MKLKKMMMLFCLIILSLNAFSAESKGTKRGGKGWRESYGGDSAIAEFKYRASDIFNFAKYDSNYKELFPTIKSIIVDSEIDCVSEYYDSEYRNNYYIISNTVPGMITIDCDKWNNSLTTKSKDIVVVEALLSILRSGKINNNEVDLIINKYLEFKKRIVGSRGDQSLKTLNFKLLLAIMDCATTRYYKLIEQGADVFDGSDNEELNYLYQSLNSGCREITMDLLKNYVPFNFNKKNVALFMKIALDYHQELFSFEDRKIILKALVDRNQDFIKASIPNDLSYLSYIPGIETFYVGRGCEVGSTPLHFWSSGSFYLYLSKDPLTDKYKILDERNYHQENIQFYKDLGFKQSTKNSCGKTSLDYQRRVGM